MTKTLNVPVDYLAGYLDGFAKRFLGSVRPRSVDVEYVERELGDQFPVEGARLVGIAYDRHDDAVQLLLESGDHRVERPRSVWAIEEPDGFVSVLSLVGSDGHREIVTVKRVGIVRCG